MKEIQGKEVFVLDMGEVNFPTGEILVRDPLVWLHRDEKPYLQSVPVGKFRIKTLVAKIEEDHYRYVMSRVKFTEEEPVVYYEALKGDENLDSLEAVSYTHLDVYKRQIYSRVICKKRFRYKIFTRCKR